MASPPTRLLALLQRIQASIEPADDAAEPAVEVARGIGSASPARSASVCGATRSAAAHGQEARAFLDAVASDRLVPLYTTAIATGMRQGELLALRWSDVDLDVRTINVRHTLRLGTRTLAQPKTERARRTLRIGADVAGLLREHRVRQLEERLAAGSRWHDGDFVFPSSTGTPLDSRNVTHALQDALRRAGLPRQRFHDLRHAYATLMLEDGEELAVISRSLGHSNLSTTADVYAHLTHAMLERSAARMDAILGKRATG